MFDEFFGDLSDRYSDVDSFFKDVTGGSSILDTIKTGVGAFYGNDPASKAVATTSTKSRLDLDDALTSEPKGVMSALERALTDTQPIQAADPQEANERWFNITRYIATGEEYAQ
jgi:hypothetical protein